MKKIAIVDFGGQYTHLIARRIRELGVYSEIINPEDFKTDNEIVGIIFSGGPQSVNAEDAYKINLNLKTNEIPILGICYGHQLLAKMVGGEIESGENKEYGFTSVTCETENSKLLNRLNSKQKVWMSHGDHVSILPKDFKVTASTDSVEIVAYESDKYFGLQFHPEVTHTDNGMKMLDNFIEVCTSERDWKVENFKQELIDEIRQKVRGRKLVLLLSGGVDSLVALELCIQAVGNENVFSIHVDTGFMRQNESTEIMEHFDKLGFENIKIINAEELYLNELKGVVEPEAKRLIIGKLFVDIANEELAELSKEEEFLLVQGTIYPDTVESGSTDKGALIKTHHNRVSEVQKMMDEGKIIEPIKELYKDEVRELGEELGLPKTLVHRHPFPGPGLAIRVICSDTEINDCHAERSRSATKKSVSFDSAQDDTITTQDGFEKEETKLNEILNKFELEGSILPIKSVGVQGDFRTYHHPAVIWFKERIAPDWKILNECSAKVINKLKTVNRLIFSLQPAIDLKLEKLYLEKQNLDKLRKVDAILRTETDHIPEIWQMPVVSLPLFNETGQAFVMRPVCSTDAMTASVYEMDFKEFKRLSNLISTIDGVGNLLYDITTKPPGTIEWE
ncbi:MAG: glutamine-hydrolyzing GMP synthase [Candidatus Cloacimonadota bacterium]|nr:glutamine-hydrolyzing GMP synthase [Candidatus Cloacimonadota bacterium]